MQTGIYLKNKHVSGFAEIVQNKQTNKQVNITSVNTATGPAENSPAFSSDHQIKQ